MTRPSLTLPILLSLFIARFAQAAGGLALVKEGKPAGCIVVEAGAMKAVGQPEGRKGLPSSGPGQVIRVGISEQPPPASDLQRIPLCPVASGEETIVLHQRGYSVTWLVR
jgi:hypothetical protein